MEVRAKRRVAARVMKVAAERGESRTKPGWSRIVTMVSLCVSTSAASRANRACVASQLSILLVITSEARPVDRWKATMEVAQPSQLGLAMLQSLKPSGGKGSVASPAFE